MSDPRLATLEHVKESQYSDIQAKAWPLLSETASLSTLFLTLFLNKMKILALRFDRNAVGAASLRGGGILKQQVGMLDAPQHTSHALSVTLVQVTTTGKPPRETSALQHVLPILKARCSSTLGKKKGEKKHKKVVKEVVKVRTWFMSVCIWRKRAGGGGAERALTTSSTNGRPSPSIRTSTSSRPAPYL